MALLQSIVVVNSAIGQGQEVGRDIFSIDKAPFNHRADPKLKVRLAELGARPFTSSPTEFGQFIVDETEKRAKVVRAAGIKAE